MSTLRLVGLLILLPLVFACGGYSSNSTTPSPVTPSAPASTGPSSSVDIVQGAETLGARAFAPDELEITAGTTVTWTNTDSVAHTSTSDAAGWNSGIVAPGGRFSAAFPTAGTFSYHCAIHPGMIGKVTVR